MISEKVFGRYLRNFTEPNVGGVTNSPTIEESAAGAIGAWDARKGRAPRNRAELQQELDRVLGPTEAALQE